MDTKSRKRRTRILIPFITIIIIVYVGISVYFMEHFFWNTAVNGTTSSCMTVDKVNEAVRTQMENYQLTLKERGGEEILSTRQLGIQFVLTDETWKAKRRQNGFVWPRMFFMADSYQVTPEVVIDDEVFDSAVEGLNCIQNGVEPVDAAITIESGSYVISEEQIGNKVNEEVLKNQMKQAVSNLQKQLDLEAEECYQIPTVTAAQPKLVQLCRNLQELTAAKVTYTFGTRTEVVDASVMAAWITIQDTEAEMNLDAVSQYIASLAESYDTVGKERVFQSSLRGEITVGGGAYGWEIDQKAEAEALLGYIQNKTVITKEPAYLKTARSREENDIGNTYIEIDLSAQHMWFYKEGKLVIDTDVVSGNLSRRFGTPEMVASILYKQRNRILRGDNYATHVSYWLPFYKNYGIHDASWRKSFGGDIYKTKGSHGCVNTPPANVKVIYENIEEGTPVVLYY